MANRDYRTMTLEQLFVLKRRIESVKNPTNKELEESRRIENELAKRILLDN